MTRDELITKMVELNACASALEWVEDTEGMPMELFYKCEIMAWPLWLLGRLRPADIVIFSSRCAARANTPRAWEAAWDAFRHFISDDPEAAGHLTRAATVASWCARSAYGFSEWEKQRQLTELRAIALKVFGDETCQAL